MSMATMTQDELCEEMERRFGPDPLNGRSLAGAVESGKRGSA